MNNICTYDIDLDIKLLKLLESEKDNKMPITHMKNYSEVHHQRLEEHLDYLKEWNMIVDTKANGYGKSRIISFARDSTECILELVNLKLCIDKVNSYFSK